MTQPEVESNATVKAPANGGTRQRNQDEGSQPAKLARPLKESARLANKRTSHTLDGKLYEVSDANGYRRG